MKKQYKKSWSTFFSVVMLGVSLLCVNSPVNASVIKTDIVMLVDESGSMTTIHDNLTNNIGRFASILEAGGLDVQFALVGFGFFGDTIRLLSPFVDAADFAAGMAKITPAGSYEPVYDATAFALNELPSESAELVYREDAVKNLILFSDESSNGDNYFDASSIDAVLKQNNALFNVVIGGEFTELETLAANNGGNRFDLNELNTANPDDVDAFVANFAEVKLQETLDFCDENPNHPACTGNEPVPAPAGLALFALGLLLVSRRQIQ